MPRHLFALSLSLSFLSLSAPAEEAKKEISILFLGNSYTNRHDIPDLVEAILEEGDHSTDVKVERVIYGGQNMFKHSTYYFSESVLEQSTITDAKIEARIAKMEGYLESDTAPNPEEWDTHWKAVGKEHVSFVGIHQHIRNAIKRHQALLHQLLQHRKS